LVSLGSVDDGITIRKPSNEELFWCPVLVNVQVLAEVFVGYPMILLVRFP
jgi:hypothetical protein